VAGQSVQGGKNIVRNNVSKPAINSTDTAKIANATHRKSHTQQSLNKDLSGNITQNDTVPLLADADTANKKKINANERLAAQEKPKSAAKDTESKPVAAAKKPSGIDELFAADQSKTPGNVKPKIDSRVKVGVYAATYFNYAKNGNNQVNAGAGFTVSIPLAQNLHLVTGASVNQNSFNYGNQGGLTAAPEVSAYFNVATPNFKAAETTITQTGYSNSASLLGIDVPLNLQYQFTTRKNPIYVLGGFSSGSFINESYGYVYANGSTVSSQSYKGLNNFYLARTLNFAFGVGYPVGKSQIIFEPFLKYPLEGMGAQQLKFGASGINLKFNFPTKNK
jgi:hypothetical protein